MAEMIVTMIINRLVSELEAGLKDVIPEDDPTLVYKVKAGRFQEGPETTPLRIAVMSGDLEDRNWADTLSSNQESDRTHWGFHIWPREIGGGEHWWRRGTILPDLYFLMTPTQPDEEKARELAYVILGRCLQILSNIDISDLEDDFGEIGIKLFSTQNALFQAGGPPNYYLYKGKILWAALTERTEF